MNRMQRGTAPLVLGVLTIGGLLAVPLSAQEPTVGEPLPPLPPEGTPLVFVNTQVILPIAPGADSAQAAFQLVLNEFDLELQDRAAEIDSLLAAYRQQESLLDPAGREQKQQEILAKQQEAQARQQELNIESDRRRTELLAPILERVTAVIDEIRAERSYSIVLDLTESGVVAADAALDITPAVLERLGVAPDTSASTSGR